MYETGGSSSFDNPKGPDDPNERYERACSDGVFYHEENYEEPE